MSDDDFEDMSFFDLEAEQVTLGAALLSPHAASAVAERLNEGHFYRAAHQTIFGTIATLSGRGEPTDVFAVKGMLQDRGELGVTGGPLYLHSLIEMVPTATNIDFYIERLLDKGDQRGLARMRVSLKDIIASPNLTRDERLDAVWQALEQATGKAVATPMTTVADLVFPVLDRLEKGTDTSGVTHGWTDLANIIPRFKPGQLITVGARPGMGKSVVMANIAYHVGVELQLPVFFGTLEMSHDELMLRFFARAGKVDLKRLNDPDLLTEDDWDRLRRANKILSTGGKLVVDDEPGMGVAYFRSKLREMRRAGMPPSLVVIDYLQLMQSGKGSESRQAEVGQISRSLKLLAKEFGVPIIIGSQLNRMVEQRSTKRPTAADLRESGSIEQDSDIVILLYREDAYDPESPRAGEIDLIVDKNRSGPRGTAALAWQGHYARAADLAHEPWTPTGSLGGGQ